MAGEEDKKNAIAAANLAVVKSGTVALEVAMAGVPMLVAYRVNPISAWFFRRISLIKYANLVNIIEGKEIIPELLQDLCTPLLIANAAAHLLSSPEHQRRQKEQAAAALKKLLPPNGERPSDIAARAIMYIIS